MFSKLQQAKAVSFLWHGMTEDTISGVHVSPGSAETLVRRGGITNYLSIAYSASNIPAKKNYKNCWRVLKLVCYIGVVFFETQ